jgi:hypothetical protein
MIPTKAIFDRPAYLTDFLGNCCEASDRRNALHPLQENGEICGLADRHDVAQVFADLVDDAVELAVVDS